MAKRCSGFKSESLPGGRFKRLIKSPRAMDWKPTALVSNAGTKQASARVESLPQVQ